MNSVESLFVDDRRNLNFNPLRGRTRPPVAAVEAIELVPTAVGRRRQEIVHTSSREAPAASSDAALIEIASNRLDPHRTTFFPGCEIEDQPHDARLVVAKDEHLLILCTPALLYFRCIAERRLRAVPKPLTGILKHRPVHVFGVLARLMLIKNVQNLADELATGILANGLRYRDEFDARLP
nr:hypothetical protein [Hyphomicrobium sp.]